MFRDGDYKGTKIDENFAPIIKKPLGLMLHSIGTPQPNATYFTSAWNTPSWDTTEGRENAKAVHAFIDANTGIVYQTLPWNYMGWHSGHLNNDKLPANRTHIGVEMNEPGSDIIKYAAPKSSIVNIINPDKAKEMISRTYNSAVNLFAYLSKQYGLNPLNDGVIISHSEGYKKGIANNHADVEHLWNKVPDLDYNMNKFRQDVKNAMNGTFSLNEEKEINSFQSWKDFYKNGYISFNGEKDWYKYIVEAGLETGIDPTLLAAIIRHESASNNPNIDIQGDNGNAYGLMQLWQITQDDVHRLYPDTKKYDRKDKKSSTSRI